MKLWDTSTEIQFFKEALRSFASPEQLFYSLKSGSFAYIPKNIDSEGQTLQSRNTLIGKFTERWTRELFSPIAQKIGLYAVNDVVCEAMGLSRQSRGDLALCTKKSTTQKPEDIKLLFEIKMSVVSNYQLCDSDEVKLVGDYESHKGNPSLLRSDSMLKAIGKSVNIRVSGIQSAKIPIVILGNSPVTKSYVHKVDYLRTAGVIQGFWSLYPEPTESEHIKVTPQKGFQTVKNPDGLSSLTNELVNSELNYFSSMISKKKLGDIIQSANREKSNEAKAQKFLDLLKGTT